MAQALAAEKAVSRLVVETWVNGYADPAQPTAVLARPTCVPKEGIKRTESTLSRLAMSTVIGASLLLLAACSGDAGSETGRGEEKPSAAASSPSSPTSAPRTETTTAQTHTPSPEPAPTTQDLSLMRDFVSFAVQPSPETTSRLPLADEVALGLSRDLKAILDKSEAPDPSAWVLRAKHFRAYTDRSAPWKSSSTMSRRPGPTPWAVAAPSTSPSATIHTARAHRCPHHRSSRTIGECPSSPQTLPSTVVCRGSPLTSSWTIKEASLRSRLTSGNRRRARHPSEDGALSRIAPSGRSFHIVRAGKSTHSW